jgi:VWFA-related protein
MTDRHPVRKPAFPRRVLSCGLVVLLLAGASVLSRVRAQDAPKPPSDDQSVIRVDVDLVNILFAVRTKKGQLIPNLNKESFQLFEDGKKQEVKRFSRENDLPLTLGLLIDISASQERLIDIERDAASRFFGTVIRPKDEAFLISFGKSTDLLQDYTSSPNLLKSALRDLKGDGGGPMPMTTGPVPTMGRMKGTLLFDAVYLAANEKLRGEVGRKALILITDGEDQGSFYNVKNAIEQAQRSDTIIYSIYYVDPAFYARGRMSFGGGGEGDLKKMSAETGGRVMTVDRSHTLDDVFKEIQEELRNQYTIGYTPANTARDGSFRKIDIKVDQPDLIVQARKGYYATPADGK